MAIMCRLGYIKSQGKQSMQTLTSPQILTIKSPLPNATTTLAGIQGPIWKKWWAFTDGFVLDAEKVDRGWSVPPSIQHSHQANHGGTSINKITNRAKPAEAALINVNTQDATFLSQRTNIPNLLKPPYTHPAIQTHNPSPQKLILASQGTSALIP